jgi:polyphosphate kinase
MSDTGSGSKKLMRHTIFDDPALFIDRDLSLIEFQRRVFDEARDASNPLLERVKFLSIVVRNFDEFEMVRMPQLAQDAASGEHFDRLRSQIVQCMREVRQYLHDSLIPDLAREGIHILEYTELTASGCVSVNEHFKTSILPVLMPLAFDPKRPFPHIPNLALHLAIRILDAKGRERFACVHVPDSLPQFVEIPGKAGLGLVWLEQVIAANLPVLFTGVEVMEVEPFRLVRHGDIAIEQLESGRLLDEIEHGARQREFSPVSVLLAAEGISERLLDILLHNLSVVKENAYRTGKPLALARLMELVEIDRPDLRDPPLKQRIPAALIKRTQSDIFSEIRRNDILLHHPFESYQPVVDFLRQAAADPDVLSIRSTLYRVGPQSPVVEALVAASRNGKKVAVVVELTARFDEVSNVSWARALEDAGAHVVYGMVDLKVHAKLTLVVRRENARLRSYVHIASGNYNTATSKVYTDLSLFTCDDEIAADATDVFNYLTGFAEPKSFRKFLVAPINMRQRLQELILREIGWQQRDGHGHIIFKMNSLVDREMIQLLYQASAAGVRVDLIVRGACSLRPGLPTASKNIRVRSIVGRLLEHSRIYYFQNGGNDELYIGSADLRPRNLDRRVEVLAPVKDAELLQRLRDEILAVYLADNAKARELLSDGHYDRVTRPEGEPPISAQQLLADGIDIGRR